MNQPPPSQPWAGRPLVPVWSHGLWRNDHLALFFGQPVAILPPFAGTTGGILLGWGKKPSGLRALARFQKSGQPCLLLEDGFLRSVELGHREPPWSLVMDDQGIYYDATRPSRLEQLIARGLSPQEEARAVALADGWRQGRVSKYNHLREYAGPLPDPYVLVVDQTRGDASLRYGMAGEESFQQMLRAALEENPECNILVKIHPDVFAGRKKGHYNVAELKKMARVTVLGEDCHPVGLLEQARGIYVVTSQMGFEGLLWGKRVHTFGMPFYAGWGLTRDRLPPPSRRGAATLAQVVHGALVDYPRYLDPETGKPCPPERLLDWLALQRRMRQRFAPQLHAVAFSHWKKPIVQSFFQGSTVHFVETTAQAPEGATVAVWGMKDVLNPEPEMRPHHKLRLEDGFLRSVGLGADFVRPLSWVMDGRGIYYDATRPSDLEHLLQNAEFPETLLARARRLRQEIVTHGLTKYNVGATGWQRPAAQRVILAPGQVESDASLRFGAPGIRGNMALLQAVRQENPAACLIYKPHPDVVAGLRGRGVGEEQAHRWCDQVVIDCPMGELLGVVDEVHVLTSLAGFEALLRGKTVVCHGQPFYAGWGLTRDMIPLPRRRRVLSLDELTAGVLLLYPVYVSRKTGRFTTPERALEELLAWRREGPPAMPWWRKGWRWLMRWTHA